MNPHDMNDHVTGLLETWDPSGEADIPDAVALHLDACPACHAAFEARFPPAGMGDGSTGRGARVGGTVGDWQAPPSRAVRIARTVGDWQEPPGSAVRLARTVGDWRSRQAPRRVLAGVALAAVVVLGVWGMREGPGGRDPAVEGTEGRFPDATAAWTAFEAANEALDGERAREAVEAYLALAPSGPEAGLAGNARRRLALVGTTVGAPQVRWLGSAQTAGGDWIGVLWQLWCRYCLPALRAIEDRHLPYPVFALTTASRGATDGEIMDRTAGLSLPVGVLVPAEDFDVGFWPTAMLVCDGEIAWVGGVEALTGETVARGCGGR